MFCLFTDDIQFDHKRKNFCCRLIAEMECDILCKIIVYSDQCDKYFPQIFHFTRAEFKNVNALWEIFHTGRTVRNATFAVKLYNPLFHLNCVLRKACTEMKGTQNKISRLFMRMSNVYERIIFSFHFFNLDHVQLVIERPIYSVTERFVL